MNYEPNTKHHQIGDIVLHHDDAKEPTLMMRVIGYTRAGLCKTQYVDTNRRRTIRKNGIEFLYDPMLWGIHPQWANHHIDSVQNMFETVRYWNQRYGTVTVRLLGGDAHNEIVQTVSPAYMTGWGDAMVRVSGRGTWWLVLLEVVK